MRDLGGFRRIESDLKLKGLHILSSMPSHFSCQNLKAFVVVAYLVSQRPYTDMRIE